MAESRYICVGASTVLSDPSPKFHSLFSVCCCVFPSTPLREWFVKFTVRGGRPYSRSMVKAAVGEGWILNVWEVLSSQPALLFTRRVAI